MISLDTHLNSLNFSTQLNVIKNLVDSAHAKTTFCGRRTIEVTGFTGSVSIDEIAKKVLTASRERCHANSLTTQERISGIEIVRKLKEFYRDTDTEIKNANFITKVLNWIREFSFAPNGTVRSHIFGTPGSPHTETASRNFCTYTREQFSREDFFQHFGRDNYDHPAIEGADCFPHPQMLYVKEDYVLGLYYPTISQALRTGQE